MDRAGMGGGGDRPGWWGVNHSERYAPGNDLFMLLAGRSRTPGSQFLVLPANPPWAQLCLVCGPEAVRPSSRVSWYVGMSPSFLTRGWERLETGLGPGSISDVPRLPSLSLCVPYLCPYRREQSWGVGGLYPIPI